MPKPRVELSAVYSARLPSRASGEITNAQIRLARQEDLSRWSDWVYRGSDEDREWDWWKLYWDCKRSAGRYECYCVIAADELHGLFILDLRKKKLREGAAIVLDYLATNPANRHPNRGLRLVGVASLAVAVSRSIEVGTEGRLWLESLQSASVFYQAVGFQRQASRSAAGHPVYLLGAARAKSFLEEIRLKGIVAI